MGNDGKFKVTVNNVSYGEFSVTGHILVYGVGGDDRIQMSGSVAGAVILFGGDGDDELMAGDSSAILFGGAGNDSLSGGKKRSILVGGDGEDRLNGGQDDDILIGNIIEDQMEVSRLISALDTWNRVDRTYLQRITLLGGTLGISDLQIVEDRDADILTGSSGLDWYFSTQADKATGVNPSEIVTF